MKKVLAIGIIILIVGCKSTDNIVKNSAYRQQDNLSSLEPITKTGLYFDLKQHTFFSNAKFNFFTISDDESMLVYSAKIDSEYYHLYLQNPYNKSFNQITSGNSNNTFPHLSSDKKKITFVSDRDGYTNIYVADLDKTFVLAQITDDKSEKLLPIFSPDNTKILYTSRESGKYTLIIIDLDTKIKTYLGEGVGFSWLQNNKILFMKPQSNKTNALWTIDVNKLNISQIIYDNKKFIVFPTTTPKGDIVTYSKASQPINFDNILTNILPPTSDVWLTIIENNKRVEYQIINDEYNNFNPTFAGNRIYFISDRNEAQNIWSLKASIETP